MDSKTPAVGAVEVAIVGVVTAVRMDEVGIDRSSIALAEHPGRLTPDWQDANPNPHRCPVWHDNYVTPV